MGGENLKPVNGVLLLYSHPYGASAPTIMEHVNAFEKHSKHKVWKINTEFGYPRGLSQLKFKIVVLHYSLFGSLPFKLNGRFMSYLSESAGSFKVCFFQDEMQHVPKRFALLNELGIDCIYSLLDPQYFQEVYYGNTKAKYVLPTLTGYVEDGLIEKSLSMAMPFSDRTTDVGYRARPLPFFMGKGGQEKTQIAEKFLAHAEGRGLSLDIKTREADRIYGDAWYRFLANCKAVLGVEAGVSIFDIGDTVKPAVDRLISDNPGISFEEVHDRVLRDWEERIHYRTISPRVFEAAALKVCQVLYEGAYQGILEPMVHYIPLKKDFSNFEAVIGYMRDEGFVKELTDRARKDLVDSGRYSFRQFIAEFDRQLLEWGFNPGVLPGEAEAADRELSRGLSLRMARIRVKHMLHKKWPGKPLVKKLYNQLKNRKKV